MRTVFTGLLLFIITSGFAQQRYISSGIIAYSGGAYERAVSDLNYVLEEVKILSHEEAAKAYFYRGISVMRLAEKKPSSVALIQWPYLQVAGDFGHAVDLNGKVWRARIEPEVSELYLHLFDQGVTLYRQAEESSFGSEAAIHAYGLTIDHLLAARKLRDNYDVNFQLGKGYHHIADSYARARIDRFTANYQAAIASYEQALDYRPESLECINALIMVARILEDQERIRKYRLIAARLTANSR